ncbi:hypothetical protein Tco_1122169 [Tanacetum coccineum]|uniref:Uncharacterized protein n=1 Tax=Tanacetum coccineum TaxID=301880 RepID=A0ABQ5IZT8_9ASTR
MALPPRDQRHQYLRYEGLQYTDANIVDFETRLARIYRRVVHRVHVFDFGGLPDLMAKGLSVRMLIKHKDAQGVSLFTSQAWRRLFDIRGLLTDPRQGDLRDYWIGISSARDFLGTAPSYTAIRDLILRLCHRLITCSISRRSQAPEKVTVTDLFYLRGMDVSSVNTEPTPVKHYCKPFKYKTGSSEWPTCSWKNDGYCNGGNLHGAYFVVNSLHYQDYEWYEALKDSELKDEALRNKAIMEGLISDNESSNDCWKRWKSHEINYHDYNKGEYENETHEGGHELCGIEYSLKDKNKAKTTKSSTGMERL